MTQSTILIKNGKIVDSTNRLDCHDSIIIENGKITIIGDIPNTFTADQTIDATDCIISPGFIDLATHLPEPGMEQKGTILSETRAAVAGGFTHICCTPDLDPVIDTAAVVNFIHDKALQADSCHVYPIGALTKKLAGEQLSDLFALKEAKVIALTNLRKPFTSNQILHSALAYAATHDLLVMLHPEDSALANQGCVHDGKMSTFLGLTGIPSIAETVALARDLILVKETGIRAHFSQISTARSVEMIAQAKQQGLPVTADVAMQQLLFTEEDINHFDTNFHLSPPVRAIEDRDALLHGINTGIIDAICSNHRPHEWSAKNIPFAASAKGMSTLETILPSLVKLTLDDKIDLNTLLTCLTHGPAGIIGKTSGIKIGNLANLCIFNPTLSWNYSAKNSFSQGKNSPFLNQHLTGRVTHTLVDGKTVYAL